MKIIAKTEFGWLLDGTDDEIATLQGLNRIDKRFHEPKAGDEFQITEIYNNFKRAKKFVDLEIDITSEFYSEKPMSLAEIQEPLRYGQKL